MPVHLDARMLWTRATYVVTASSQSGNIGTHRHVMHAVLQVSHTTAQKRLVTTAYAARFRKA